MPVPINFLLRTDDFDYILGDSYAALAVVDAPFLDQVGPAAEAHDIPVLVGGGEGEETVESWLDDGGHGR